MIKITPVQELLANRILARCDASASKEVADLESSIRYFEKRIAKEKQLLAETNARGYANAREKAKDVRVHQENIRGYEEMMNDDKRALAKASRNDAALSNKKWNVICTITHPTRMESSNKKKLRFNSDTSVIAPTESEAKTKAVKYFTDKGYSNVVVVSVMDLG